MFVGGVGTGKTHLSIALGMACCQHGYRVRFVTAAELVTMLVEAQQQGRLARQLAQLARFDVVHVDELGYVPLDKTGADLLFGFISQRYERRSLVVTTNLPFARWSEVFLDPTAGSREEGSSLMPLGCALRFEPRSCGPAGVSTRCAPPPLRYGPAGDTPSVPPLRQQIWALRPGLDGSVPAVHDVSRDTADRRLPIGTAASRLESPALSGRPAGRSRAGSPSGPPAERRPLPRPRPPSPVPPWPNHSPKPLLYRRFTTIVQLHYQPSLPARNSCQQRRGFGASLRRCAPVSPPATPVRRLSCS